MTAWQDQPPQSRRELRLSEQRGAEGNNNTPSEDELAEQRSRDAEASGDNVARPDWASSPRRRSQHAYAQGQDAAARPSQIPSYGGPSFGAGAAGLPTQPVAPVTHAGPESQTPDARHPHRADAGAGEARAPRVDDTPPAYRVREFNPESRRSVYSATSELSASDWSKPGAAGEPVDLDYHTQQRPDASVEPVQGPVESSGPARPQANSEHTLTRRELRAMRQASERAAEQAAAVEAQPAREAATAPSELWQPEIQQPEIQQPEPQQQVHDRAAPQPAQVAQPLLTPPPLQAPAAPAPQSSQELSRAMAEFDTLIARDSQDAPAAADATGPSVFTPVPTHPAGTADEPSGHQQGTIQQGSAQSGSDRPGSDKPDDDRPHGRAIEEDPTAEKVYTVPTGHWSTQGAIDDETQPGGVTLSRNVAVPGSPVTASHLVISSIPTANDLLLPFSATGEIMVTGTIDLPRSLATTGAHPARYDHSDVDALLEASDREDSNVDSAPVRAIRAVSTHTSSRGLIGTVKLPRSSRLPMVLAISTAAVAAAVVVLFVAGFVLHLF